MTSLEEVTKAIYGQESSGGKADTSKVNYAGATGPMQVIASTFDAMKNKGMIPKDYQHTNPEHSKAAGETLVASLYEKFGGAPDKVFAAYYAGEKAVRADGSIANFRDLKNPKAPTTHEYVAQTMARLGVKSDAAEPQEAPSRPTGDDWFTQAMPARDSVAKPAKAVADKSATPIQGSAPLDGAGVVSLTDALETVEAAERKVEAERQSSDFIDKSRAAFIQNTFAGSAIRANSVRQYAAQFDPEPGFQIDPKKLGGYTSDEQDFLREATSPQHLSRIEWEIGNRRDDLKTINASGTGVGIAASLFAGLPEGYLTGLGSMRALQLAKVGSLEFAVKGAKGAAIASSLAENVGANVGLTAIQSSFDPYVGSSDYAMAVGGGLLGLGLNAPSIFSAAGRGEVRRAADRLMEASANKTWAVREEALRNLGPDATPAQLQSEAKRIEGNDIRREVTAAQAEPPANRRLFPEDEKLRADVPEEAPKAEPAAPRNDKPFSQRLDDALEEFDIPVWNGDRARMVPEHTGYAANKPTYSKRIELPDMDEEEFVKLHGNSREDVKSHEFGHAFFHDRPIDFKTTEGRKLRGEMVRASQEFRPTAWERFPKYANTKDELLADSMAFWIKNEDRRAEFPMLTNLINGYADPVLKKHFNWLDPSMAPEAAVKAEIANDPVAIKHGLNLLPVDNAAQQAEAKAVIDLYKKADESGYKVDPKRLSTLMETSVFQGGQSTSNTMLRSENPVVRMAAAEMVESPSGAAGRRATAAISKWMKEQQYLGNTLNEFQDFYKQYRNSQGGNIVGDFFGGTHWAQFNRLVAEEMESRIPGRALVDSPPAVRQAADALEQAYERMRISQTDAKTIGWASLPESSVGYMPHRMSPEKVRNMTNKQAEALHQALTDQFVQIEGFDLTFSDKLASKYLDRVRRRALGGYEAPAGIHQVGAADVVEDALEAMGMTQPQVKAMMGKYMAGGAGHTKRRLKLDLMAEHDMGDGTSFRLMDLFETDQFKLLRQQAQRVSGEVALAQHGVMGKAGLKLLRRAMEFGADGQKAQPREIEAFDQIAAEFLGDSFGTQSKMVDRVLQVNSLSRLGGMGFTQFAEAINGIWHVGALKTLDSIGSMGRLRSEIKALARGEKVDNPIIGSLEQYGGAEFGTEAYKTVFPFDNQSLEYHTYGQDTTTAADRLLRGSAYAQGKLSLWRSIHSTQQRGMAEQIVRKAAEYLKNGGNDAALRDMGITDDLIGRMRGDIGSIAQFDGNRLTNFDITKATDVKAAEEFTQAIHRGVSQIIQGTFIGERGKWAHDGIMRMMTQFRTFSLTSVEKQWGRQYGNVGGAKLMGMMLGSMSLAAPLYMARTYLNSVGRSDQDAYLEKYLTPAQIARASLNYIAMSGLAGDFLDGASAVSGVGKVTGGRSAAESQFVGNMIAPSVGLVDDVWKGLQNTKEGTDPHELVKALPFSRLPWMIPAINALD